MGYRTMKIKEAIIQIKEGKAYLPAIQRKFVWKPEQIECLFDSIMLGYPIGTFLFWRTSTENVNKYVFYKFMQEYHEKDNYVNELAPTPQCDSIIGVLDGQQRLSALYLALQGSYAYKRPYAARNNDNAYPRRHLCFNLLNNTFDIEKGVTYEFKFLTDTDIKIDNDHHWFLVKDVLTWNTLGGATQYVREKNLNDIALNNLTLLWQRMVSDDVINYFEVETNELDNVLDIFIRVNSGGTPLSKSDLLFSTIVANWENAREKIDELLEYCKNKNFAFDNDFIMRLCLFLLDVEVKFVVKNFSKNNVEEIKNKWDTVEESLKKTIEILIEFGLSTETMTTKNIVIPIVYHIFKGGSVDKTSMGNMQKYLIYGMLKKILGSSGDAMLSKLRDSLRTQNTEKSEYILRNKNFDVQVFKFTFSEDDIEALFENKKGQYTFLVLSLLYPHINFSQVIFHQDHIHPEFDFKKLSNSTSDTDKQIFAQKDLLANLQLLEGQENIAKNKMPFAKWFEKNIENKGKDYTSDYTRRNFIPDGSYDFDNFLVFYSERKKLMTEKLRELLLH